MIDYNYVHYMAELTLCALIDRKRQCRFVVPVRPYAILEICRNVKVVDEEGAGFKLPDSVNAITVVRPDKATKLVVFRHHGDLRDINFALAHELGHITLHHTGYTLSGISKEQWEIEQDNAADFFAQCLLCPSECVAVLKNKYDYLTPNRLARELWVKENVARLALERNQYPVPQEMRDKLTRHFIEEFW